MHIGTPLSPSAVRVMLLGSGELGKEVIIALQRLGVETIAVDRYANAPGHQVAHRTHVIAMTDAAALKRLIEQERPHIIVPEVEAIATEALVELEERRIAEIIPTARATMLTMNREGIRRLAAETLKLPTSTYRFAASEQELVAAIAGDGRTRGIGFPCVVKPTISSSGKGQSVVRSKGEVAAAWQYAESAARVRGSRVIVEGLVPFEYEITLLTVRARNANGEFSEVSPRPHDTGMVTMCTQPQDQFELHARAILDLPVDTRLTAVGASAVIYGQIEARGIRFENVADALSVPNSDLRLFGKPDAYRRRRMGIALATGRDIGQARERAKKCASRVTPRAA